MSKTIRIGSRGSQLALWQANHIAAQLRALGHTVEIEIIRTVGDRMQDPNFTAPATFPDGTPLDAKGIFIKEIEDALATARIDLAVHSLKDLPTTLDPRFTLAAIPPRADARDAFVCENFWGLHMLPMGARIATTSPRRQAMLLALRPDLSFVAMRGNIDTRLRKWSEGEADALVLAAAGLDRIGRTESVHQRFSIDELCPAPGQGALALETRNPDHHPTAHNSSAQPQEVVILTLSSAKGKDLLLDGSRTTDRDHPASDAALKGTGFSPSISSNSKSGALAPEGTIDRDLHTILRALNHSDTEFATQAERFTLAALGGGCQLPLGAYCHAVDDQWHLHTMVAAPDGEQVAHYIERAPRGISAAELGHLAAQGLISRGALSLLSGEAAASL